MMSPSLFRILLYISCAICGIGLLFKIASWFSLKTGRDAQSVSKIKRITAPFMNLFRALAGPRLFLFFKALLFDVILQMRILKTSSTRWIMHQCIFLGFVMLLLMHAMDEVVTKKLFPAYASTLHPYFFLRNLFGLMVLVGICIAVIRRKLYKKSLRMNRLSDTIAIASVAVIIVTGFFLDSAKIISEPVFDRMMTEYSPSDNPDDIKSLKTFWAKEYRVRFRDLPPPYDPVRAARGKEVNEQGCVSCHAHPATAFISFPLAGALAPVALQVNRSGADVWLYYIHVLACFLCLALFPFTKLFHIVTDPLTLLVSGMSDKKHPKAESAVTRRALELDACTNCSTCNIHCSVAPVYKMLGNGEILPAQKLIAIKKIARGREFSTNDMQLLSEGAFICTGCFRCTEVCPTGINLQDQWIASKEVFAAMGHPDPHVWIKKHRAAEWSDVLKKIAEKSPDTTESGKQYLNLLNIPADSFAHCIECQTCTNVCPVVASAAKPENSLDVTPQKIMNLLRMGLTDLAVGTRMAWDCVTCFQCQENCPQGIRVTEILFELKNLAYGRLRKIDRKEALRDSEGICGGGKG